MFAEIEKQRVLAGVSASELCRRAGVHQTTYAARRNGRRTVSERTLAKLRSALDELIAERRAALDEASRGVQ